MGRGGQTSFDPFVQVKINTTILANGTRRAPSGDWKPRRGRNHWGLLVCGKDPGFKGSQDKAR